MNKTPAKKIRALMGLGGKVHPHTHQLLD